MNCQAQIRIGAIDTITIWKEGKTTNLQLIKKLRIEKFLVYIFLIKMSRLFSFQIWTRTYIRSDKREHAQEFFKQTLKISDFQETFLQ